MFEKISIAIAALIGFNVIYMLWEGLAFEARTREFAKRARESKLSARPPRVTVIVPAKNEAAAIGGCLESLAAQDYPNLEIIAIDDRSTDATGKIMNEVAARSNGLIRVVHVETLPPGWLGKNHANHLGAQAASKDAKYLLFTDGDVRFEPDTIRVSVIHCEEKGLGHFCLAPLMISSGMWLAAVQLVFAISFLTFLRPSRLGKAKDVYVGIGAFNMVSREAYEKIDGHNQLRLEVIDDGMLGKLVVAVGAKADLINGKQWISLAWYPSLLGFVRGLEKNAFAALRYSFGRLIAFTLAQAWMYYLPYAMIYFNEGWVRKTFIGLVILENICFAIGAWMMAFNPLLVFLLSPAALVVVFTFFRSTFYTLKRRGISWRDTHYPLEDLKRHMV